MTPKIGQTEDGYSFVGGDPADKNSWKQVGAVEDGYKFVGGDPADQNSWAPAEEAPEQNQQEPQTSTLQAVAGGIAKGGTWGFADELKGGLSAIGQTLGITDDTSSVFDESLADRVKTRYQTGRDQYKQYEEQLQKDSPAAFKSAEIGGAIGTGLIGGAGLKGAKLIGRAALEGGAYGLGESEADLTEGEFQEALKDTGIGALIGGGSSAAIMGAGKVIKSGYRGLFGKGGKDLATDAAGDILELTPKQRADASKDIVKMGPGKTSTVAEELPNYLREKGGIIQSTKQLKQQSVKALQEAGEEIETVLNTYDDTLKKLTNPEKLDVRKVKGADWVSVSPKESAIVLDPSVKNAGQQLDAFKKIGAQTEAEKFSKELAFKFSDLADKLAEDVANLRGVPGYENQLAKLDKHLIKLKNFKGSRGDDIVDSIKELHTMRKNTDKLIKSFQGPNSNQADALLQEALIKSRREMSNHLQDNMLGRVKDFAKEQLEFGAIDQKQFENLMSLQERVYKANRNYKLANFVNDQIDQAIGRKDSRRLVSLTDFILGGAVATSNPAAAIATVAGKKALEVARPRAQLYSRELGKAADVATKASRAPVTQQATQNMVTVKEKSQGTKYNNLFTGDSQADAVKHKVLMGQDPEYRKMFMEEEED
jgi:hypothetical protein